ncbi:hypothetical protein CJP74_04950 [Psittacicella melopsittaci]|uniref:Alanine racemase N-terminal domain-containing protein n=1 Tax=Psittacicella melopsittaci TaxID=2028576 RepID=A0A3A1Y3Y4_9GAMM|nr:alanine racemase [Psittacicella melopsittaci]RIY32275.1 hypothetical protein CJP74_04950 [Psittacicella melopsittaci]
MSYALYERLTANLKSIQAKIANANVELMVVSKYATTEQLFAQIVNGCTLIGENYVQEAHRKYKSLQLIRTIFSQPEYLESLRKNSFPKELEQDFALETWQDIQFLTNYGQKLENRDFILHIQQMLAQVKLHIIGNVQSRKINEVCSFADSIDAVSSEKALLKIQQGAQKQNKVMQVLLQLRSPLAQGDNRAGCSQEEIFTLAQLINSLENVSLQGLMFIASTENLPSEYEFAHNTFLQLQEKYQITTLSMGMTDSLDVAIQNGSTQVRIGSALFK